MEELPHDGILRCSRYAFGPNRLHYCGPTASGASDELLSRLRAGESAGVSELLRRFETLYPYLIHIAGENGFRDPFNARVVEAYWLGNDLLDRVEQGHFYRHLKDGLSIGRKMGEAAFEGGVAEKIRYGGLPHHSFHVLNVWKGMEGKLLEGIRDVGECLVSVGTVSSIDGPWITVATERLTFDGKRLSLAPETRRLPRPFDASEEWDMLVSGDFVSFHWGVLCEQLVPEQAERVRRYTGKSLELANKHFL